MLAWWLCFFGLHHWIRMETRWNTDVDSYWHVWLICSRCKQEREVYERET